MNYPPKHYTESNKQKMIEVIKHYPLATLISVKENKPLITHLPLILNDDDKLVGHIDKFNPQAEFLKDNFPVTVIFSGPDAYISPSLFSSKQLPTYNYIKVHLTGTVKSIDDKIALKDSLITMTEFLEKPNNKYILEANNKSMERNLDYIKMFEIYIESWEGKFKLSQDKNEDEFNIAQTELIDANINNINNFLNCISDKKTTP